MKCVRSHPILRHQEARAPLRLDLFPSLPYHHASDTDTAAFTTNRSMFNPINPFIGGAASAAAVVAAQSAWSAPFIPPQKILSLLQPSRISTADDGLEPKF
jgi:hypothetical protein